MSSSDMSPLEDWSAQFGNAGQRLHIKRDDLLPFPLAGNKVRKLRNELAQHELQGRVIVTVGAITSNHCRTVAYMGAREGARVHLVLHGDPDRRSSRVALAQFNALGAKASIVDAAEIRRTVEELEIFYGNRTLTIEGGCHTPAGVEAYIEAAAELADQLDDEPDVLLVATGTGATHAGLAIGCWRIGWKTRVLGVSIAREMEKAKGAVREAISWCEPEMKTQPIDLTAEYRAGGYGISDSRTKRAVGRSMASGLPVDATYMGKVMSAAFDLNENRRALGSNVVIWHTGGYGNLLAQLTDDTGESNQDEQYGPDV